MKLKLMALMLVAGGAALAQPRIAIGVQIGRPAPVAVVETYRPPCPGPSYVWVDGYYDEYGNWVDGYWDMPPYVGAYWVAPRIVTGRFYAGYWGGPRGVYHVDRYYRPPVYDRYDRGYHGPERHYDRGYERGYNRGYDRGYDRGHDRGHDRGYDRGPRGGEDFRHGYRR